MSIKNFSMDNLLSQRLRQEDIRNSDAHRPMASSTSKETSTKSSDQSFRDNVNRNRDVMRQSDPHRKHAYVDELAFPKLDFKNGLTYVATGVVLAYVLMSFKSGGVELELSPGVVTKRRVTVWVDIAIACVLFGYLVRFARTVI